MRLIEWTYKKIHFVYQLFPFKKYGFKPFDLFVTDNAYDRLSDIANVEEVCPTEKFVGTVDLNFKKINWSMCRIIISLHMNSTTFRFRIISGQML